MNTSIHVAFIIVADVDNVFVALRSPADGLKPDILCTAVSGVTNDPGINSVALEATPVITLA